MMDNEITNYRPLTISELSDNLALYKNDPSLAQRVILDQISTHNIMNPTNPFIFLLEAAVAATAASAEDHYLTLRKQYASMAIDREDLYLHMSDAGYQDRFASPATAEFSVVIQYDSLMFIMPDNESFRFKSAIIARDTEIMIGDLRFTMENAIEIREYKNGILTASYMDDRTGVMNKIRRTEILVRHKQMKNGEDMIMFDIDIKQFTKNPHYYTREVAIPFKKEIPFNGQYLGVDVYHRKRGTLEWVQMSISHTEEIYSTDEPVMIVEVRKQFVSVSLPEIFSAIAGVVSNEIRVDVRATEGAISVDLGDYSFEAFSHRVRAIDEHLDWDSRMEAFSAASSIFVSKGMATGGRSEIGFDEMRERVIFNNVAESKIPITDVDIKFLGIDIGFDMLVEVDSVTSRVFRATKHLGSANHEKLLTSGGSVMGSFIFSLAVPKPKKGILTFPQRMTIRENTMFSHLNGVTELISEADFRSLASENPETIRDTYMRSSLVYSPFLYAVDTSRREMNVGVYDISDPSIVRISHVKKNSSLGRDINTGSSAVRVGVNRIDIRLSIPPVKNIPSVPVGQLLAQISFISAEDGQRYWARTYRDDGDHQSFTLSFKTFFEINPMNNSIHVFDVFDAYGAKRDAYLPLDGKIIITYGTDSMPAVFKREAQVLYNDKIERLGGCGISSESGELVIAKEVQWLWKNYRSSDYAPRQATYRHRKVKVWPRDVWEIDPESGTTIKINRDTCEVERCLLHRKGDPVLDDDGELQYEYLPGDLIPRYPGDYTSKELFRSVDMLLIDAAYLLGQDPVYDRYRARMAAEIAGWSHNQIGEANAVVLEQSAIYYHPKNSIGYGYTDDGPIDLQVSVVVELNVPDSVMSSSDLKRTISRAIVTELDHVFAQGSVSMSNVYLALREVYESSIFSMDVSIKGMDQLPSTTIVDGISSMALKKVLRLRENSTLEIAEDVDVYFNKELFLEMEER